VLIYLGALIQGLILAPLALGVLVSFRICRVLDLTVDGAFTFGGAMTACLLVRNVSPWPAAVAGGLAGALAGCCSGLLRTRLKVDAVLSGILTSTALYSITLLTIGRGNLPIPFEAGFSPIAEKLGVHLLGSRTITIEGIGRLAARELGMLLLVGMFALSLAVLLYFIFSTEFGLAMRAAGANERLALALGVPTNLMIVCGLALANGLVGFSGALLAQYQSYSDVQMGISMIVSGLAAVMVGEVLLGTRSAGRMILSAIAGAIAYRMAIAAAVHAGLNPYALKLVTAIFVLLSISIPGILKTVRSSSTP
jgi:putative ABC transport system permease protein